jgi:hypothetical protein
MTVKQKRTMAQLVLIMLTASLAVACQTFTSRTPGANQGEQIPFETITLDEEGTDGREYLDPEPKLFLLLMPEDITRIENFISEDSLESLQQVDFSESAVIALFQGLQGGTGFKVVIERISRHNNTLVIEAQFWEPAPGQLTATALTSPYHLVKIPKDNQLSEQTRLELSCPKSRAWRLTSMGAVSKI